MSALEALDWSCADSVSRRAPAFLQDIVQDRDGVLDRLSERMLSDEALLDQAESNPTLQRLVLYECPTTGAKLRFHVFRPHADARPHDHAWSFATFVLSGSYQHALFDRRRLELDGDAHPVFAHTVLPGHSYYMSAGALHRTRVEEPTTTLIVQGPRERHAWTRFADDLQTFPSGRDANAGKRKLERSEIAELAAALQVSLRRFRARGHA